MSIKTLQDEYDRLLALRAEVGKPAPRDGRLDAIAEAARTGEPLPDLWENTPARELKVAGVTRAVEQVAAEIVEAAGNGHARVRAQMPKPEDHETGAQYVAAVQAAYEGADRQAQAREERIAQNRLRESAKDKYWAQHSEWTRGGKDPIAFQAQLTDAEWRALNPPGSGGFQVSGRVIGETGV